MKKPVIAVDFDDVISDQNNAVRLFANKKYGLTHTVKDFSVDGEYWPYWGDIWGVSEQEKQRRVEEFHADNGTMTQLSLPHVKEVLNGLKDDFRLVIVTGREGELAKATKNWLDKHLPNMFDNIKFAHLLDKGKRVTKAVICQEIGASYLIDDHIDHCKLAAEAGVTGLLFGDWGWNRNITLPKNVYRVKNWREVKKFFDEVDK